MGLNSIDANSYLPRRVNFGWIGEAWGFFGRAAGIWIVATLLYGIVSNLIQILLVSVFPNPFYVPPPSPFGQHFQYRFGPQYGYGTNSNMTPIGQGISLVFVWLFGAFQSASLYRLAVRQVRGQPVGFGDIVAGGQVFMNMLLFGIFIALATFVGALAVCIGIFIAIGFLLPGYALVADGQSATDALRSSFDAMKQEWLNAALFVFVFGLLIAASALPCGLGLLATIPMLHLVSALAYRDMVGMPGQSAAGYGEDTPQPGVWPPPPQI